MHNQQVKKADKKVSKQDSCSTPKSSNTLGATILQGDAFKIGPTDGHILPEH